ncbi:YkuS family protein [Tepidibacter mesophilus]|uniref:YkuS family protein n=1 Tax=Tepidibacter mesophilus TaxID=655607 RepID=UPI000C06A193|nr:YkuS family protein [Tepidibacter mesophilus]
MKNIAVERTMSFVKNDLKREGYQIDIIDTNEKNNPNYLNNFDALLVSGSKSNFIGIETSLTKIPVIKASGKSIEDIKVELNKIFH